MNYKNIFRLDKKLAFVLGGSGYIGQEVVNGLLTSGAKVVVMDKYKINFPKNVKFYPLNFENSKSYKKKFTSSFRKFGTPDILINASYPRSKDWKSSKSENLKSTSLDKNIKIHLNS